ncbi:MAG: TonB-dependent receptor [Alphaproteobacteria bacterium]
MRGALFLAAVAAFFIVGGGAAQAQQATDQSTASSAQAGTGEASETSTDAAPDAIANADAGGTAKPQRRRRTLDEVIVTAQKRAQSLQEVPMSVTAIGGEMIKQSDMQDMNDLSRYTPNLKIIAGGIQNTVYIRGLGSDPNEGFEQSVGLFIDDVYYGRSHYLTSALLDIERVEVLRGPQGTLFGKNTVAGAIAIHTGMPDYEFSIDVDGAIGEYDYQQLSAVVNVPIIDDRWAVRVAGMYSDRGAFLTNTFHDQDDGPIELRTFRAKTRFDVNEDMNLTLSYLYNAGELPQGMRTQLSAAPDVFLTFFRLFDPETETDIEDGQTSADTVTTGKQVSDDLIGKLSWDVWNHNLSFVIAGSAYTREGVVDADFGPTQALTLLADQTYDQWSADLKITSGLGTVEYVAGLYYFESVLSNRHDINVIPISDIFSDAVALLGPEATAPLTDPLAAILPDQPLTTETVVSFYDQDNYSMAAYGQLTWNITGKLSLIAGARYALDVKELVMSTDLESADGNVPGFAPILQTVLAAEEFVAHKKQTAKDFSPKVSVLWKAFSWGNVYATYAEGFKSGGFNANAVNDDQIEFDPEEAVTYEFGLKTEFWQDRARLNIGVFQTEFDNLQVSVFNGIETIVRNAATATSRGIEIDGTVLFDFGLMAIGSLALLDATYDEYPEGPCHSSLENSAGQGEDGNCDLSGERVAKTPDYQASLSLNYIHQMNSLPMDVFIGGDVLAHGDVDHQSDLDPLDFQEAYTLFHARVGVQASDLGWTATLAVRNITDETVLMASGDVPFYAGAHYAVVDQPRSVSLKFRAQF